MEALSSRFLISTGKSCGLHVHVGKCSQVVRISWECLLTFVIIGQGVQGFEHKTTLQ